MQQIARGIDAVDENIGIHRLDDERDLELPLATRQQMQRPSYNAVRALRRDLLTAIDAYLEQTQYSGYQNILN